MKTSKHTPDALPTMVPSLPWIKDDLSQRRKTPKVLSRKAQTLERVEKPPTPKTKTKTIAIPSKKHEEAQAIYTFSYEDVIRYLQAAKEIDTCDEVLTQDDCKKGLISPTLAFYGFDSNLGGKRTNDRELNAKILQNLNDKIVKINSNGSNVGSPSKEITKVTLKNQSESCAYSPYRPIQISEASSNKCYLKQSQIKEIALQYAQAIIDHFNSSKRIVKVELQQIEEMVKKVYNRANSYTFKSDRQLLTYLYRTVEKAILQVAIQLENEEIITRLRSGDVAFAKQFFYGRSPRGVNVFRICSLIQRDLRRVGNVELSHTMIATYIYEFFMENNWEVLNKFNNQSSIFTWMISVCYHSVYSRLRQEGFIPGMTSLTPSTTYLKIARMNADARNTLIDDLVHDPVYRKALKSYFASKEGTKPSPVPYGNDSDDGRVTGSTARVKPTPKTSARLKKKEEEETHSKEDPVLEKAINQLKQRILDAPEEMSDIISPNVPTPKMVQFDENNIQYCEEPKLEQDANLEIYRKFEQIISHHPQYRCDLDYEHNLINIVLDKMPLSKRDRKILKLHLLNKMSSQEIADVVNLKLKNVNQICYRLRPALCQEIERWWHKNLDKSFTFKRALPALMCR